MEAPEKIYLQDSMSTDTIGKLWPEWFDAKVSDNSIEYTRTDAFIEKALEWLRKEIRPYYSEIKYKYEDFKDYMKGE